MKNGVVLAEYYVTKDNIQLLGIRCDFEEPRISTISIDPKELERFISSNFGEHNRVKMLIDMGLEELWNAYDKLIEPIVEWSDPGDVICFIPHKLLHYLPLHALKIKDQYLIERNPIFYLPSASVLKYYRKKGLSKSNRKSNNINAAIFGDSCNDLIGARQEAVSIAEMLGAAPLLGSDVSRINFQRRIENAEIIHFSGHSYFCSDQIINSGLHLADNDVFTIRDILTLDSLNAFLVTLSGCETGINRAHPGDELIGLTRAFLYAGTPSIIVSLWQVADDSTTFLMKKFYSYIRNDSSIYTISALRQAILDTMTQPQWSSFYHWAPFVLVGDWR